MVRREFLWRIDRMSAVVIYQRTPGATPRDTTIARWGPDDEPPAQALAIMRRDHQMRTAIEDALLGLKAARQRLRGAQALRKLPGITNDIIEALRDPGIQTALAPGMFIALSNRLMDLAQHIRAVGRGKKGTVITDESTIKSNASTRKQTGASRGSRM